MKNRFHLKISSTNVRLETTMQQKEETFQVIIDYTIKKVKDSDSYEFLLANKKCKVDADVFRKILDICLRVEGEELTKKSRGKGSQGKKTAYTSVADVDVSEESEPEPIKKKAASRRVVKKKVTISAADNIIPDPYVSLKLDTMKALKEKKKTNKRQPGTIGSNEGTGTIPRVLDESTIVSATSTEGTGIPGVPDEEKVISKEKVILEWGSKQESEYSKEDQRDDEEAKEDAKKIEEIKDAAKKATLPPTSSNLSVSSSFGDQFLKLSSNTSLVSTVKDTTVAEINLFFDIKIQFEVLHIQSPSVLTVLVSVISMPFVLTPLQETPSVATITFVRPLFLRVAKLEKDVSELKNIDLFAEALATLKS
ncbi:hypothetical protein Tco_1111416 [Tanacetum coccineum]|uniref:Uncharacterized protein n=1 Tax=Tanacetum coccineum TaxID=301880 RepID=A0ABQ5IP18_9ASTR